MRVFLQRVRAAKVVSSLAANLTNLITVIGYAAGLALAVMLYSHGQASLGTAYLITSYVGMLGDPLQNIRTQIQDFQQATASLERVRKLFEIQPLEGNRSHIEKKLPDSTLEVCFEHVSFCYEDNEDVLHDLSFTLPPGRVLGILGRTGSGKSTLSRLLVRLYDPNQGSLRLNGLDLRTLSHDELRLQVGLVTQEVQLFQATLRQNLTFFDPEINDGALQSALESLHLWEWAASLPEGLDTLLAAGGADLSAGEAQLLAFARVLLRNPGVVILDEASSRLDPATENRMEQAVGQLFHSRTGLVIAHRLKSVARVDDILILEGGRLVEYGPRSELAADRDRAFPPAADRVGGGAGMNANTATPKETLQTIPFNLRMMRYRMRTFLVHSIFTLLVFALQIVPGLIVKSIFDTISLKGAGAPGVGSLSTALTGAGQLWWLISLYVLTGVAQLGFYIGYEWFGWTFRMAVGALLRSNLLASILRRRGDVSLPVSSGEAVNRFREDVDEVADFPLWIPDQLGKWNAAAAAVVIMARINLTITLVISYHWQ